MWRDINMSELPLIDEAKCDLCGLCVSICVSGVLQMKDNRIKVVKADECGWCTMCELVCPTSAISCPFEIIIEDEKK
jgi:MinD superfamily P-loop ATPase